MTAVSLLGVDSTLADGDSVPIQSAAQSALLRVPLSSLAAYFATKMSLPSGLLSAAGVYGMEGNNAGYSGGVAYADIPNLNPALNVLRPTNAAALFLNPLTGEFIAQRNINCALVIVAAAFTLANPRTLTLAVLTGPDVSPIEVPAHTGPITGNGAVQYASFMGLVINRNNANGQINQGDKIRLVAKTDQAATPVNFSSISTVIITLDGV